MTQKGTVGNDTTSELMTVRINSLARFILRISIEAIPTSPKTIIEYTGLIMAEKTHHIEYSAVVVDEQATDAEAVAGELASRQQIIGAALAGGITGLLIGGPFVAILLGWGGVHLAKKNSGAVGDFCRKVGHFMHRMGGAIKKEWNDARSTNSGVAEQPTNNLC